MSGNVIRPLYGLFDPSTGALVGFLTQKGTEQNTATGGVLNYADLLDSTSADLPGTNTALANALATLQSNIDSVSVGGGVGQLVAWSAAIPLDTSGAGKYMDSKSIDVNTTLTVGASPVQDGSCNICVVGDGTHTLNVDALATDPNGDLAAGAANNGYVFDHTAGQENLYAIVWEFNAPYIYGQLGRLIDSNPPAPSSAIVADLAPSVITLTADEAFDQSGDPPPASTFAVSAGHTVSSTAWGTSSTKIDITVTPAFAASESRTLAYTKGANPLKDVDGNETVNFSGQAITDNVTTPSISSLIVQDSSPGQIDVVFSEAMDQTTGATPSGADFAISAGHSVSSFTWVNSTHATLGVSPNFSASESRTLAYTGGINKLADLGGTLLANFSGVAITDNVGSGKITFTDTFTGADNDAPNGRWSQSVAGWTIQGNALSFGGSSFSNIYADCTPGDNTIDCDVAWSATFAYGVFWISRTDGSNSAYIQQTSDNDMELHSNVGGVDTVVYSDTGHERLGGSGGGPSHINITLVGVTVTVTVTNSNDDGTWSADVDPGAIGGALVGLGMNGPGKDANITDSFALT